MTAPRLSPLALLALSALGCSPRPPRGEVIEPPRPTATAAPVATTAAPAASPALPTGPRPPRSGAPGSTRGTISCGTTRCTAPGETCVWKQRASAWACVPASAAGAPGAASTYACDDGTDCPAGETCCQRFDSYMDGASCVPRAAVGSTCNLELCLHEGARCPPGRTCTSTSGDEPGDCVAPRGGATCAGRGRCPTSAPFCVMHAGKLACAARGSPAWQDATARWECTQQSDCDAADTCSFAFGEAEPEVATSCSRYSPAYRGSMVCNPAAPSPCGADVECRKTYACTRMHERLPWLGAWGPKAD